MSDRATSVSWLLLIVLASFSSHQTSCVGAEPLGLQSRQPVRGTETPESAAITMVRAYAEKDYSLFMRTRALFECEDEDRGGPNRYAESLHVTRFSNRKHSHSIYDLQTRLNPDTAHAIAKQTPKLRFIDALAFSDRVPHQRFAFFDVAIDDYDKVRHETRVIVVKFSGRWYAVPRCYSSRRIYDLADSATLAAAISAR